MGDHTEKRGSNVYIWVYSLAYMASRKSNVSVDALKSVEVSEDTHVEDYWSETTEELEVFQIEPEIIITQDDGEENEMKIEVILERPEKPQKKSKEDQPLVLVKPSTLPHIFAKPYKDWKSSNSTCGTKPCTYRIAPGLMIGAIVLRVVLDNSYPLRARSADSSRESGSHLWINHLDITIGVWVRDTCVEANLVAIAKIGLVEHYLHNLQFGNMDKALTLISIINGVRSECSCCPAHYRDCAGWSALHLIEERVPFIDEDEPSCWSMPHQVLQAFPAPLVHVAQRVLQTIWEKQLGVPPAP
ncbi:hypothetical protein Scep_009583 [Stephania cephalantha]|uniref:Uncharacterized protein n=1 Tax=Stephania cephalantha TaxID=152367 RepID=A0AAP0JTJ0_9MAGN